MVLVFDLDDTLYRELTYVKSGFWAVAEYLSDSSILDKNEAFDKLNYFLEKEGRGNVFNSVLESYNLLSKRKVKKCLSVYRTHQPSIKVDNSALKCLKRFADYPKYLVTDGNKIVQRNKVEALQIEKYFKKIFLTHNYGLKHSKPSPYCLIKIAEKEKLSEYSQIIYIGDNPNKDFIGIKPLGFKTIRIRQGMFEALTLDKKHEAHIEIKNLSEIDNNLLDKLNSDEC